MRRRVVRFVFRLRDVGSAFFRVGLQQALAYPLSFAQSLLSALIPALIFFFVSKLVPRPDYYSSVIIGLVVGGVLDIGVRGFSREIDVAINRGWLEMFLVEPVRWRSLPFAMSFWPTTQGFITVSLITGTALILGADFNVSGVPISLVMLLLSLAAGFVIGTLSATIKILAKAGDPILFIYGIATQIFSGVFFPIEVLPAPLRVISWMLPHTYAIASVRSVLLPASATDQIISIQTASTVLLLFCLIGYPLALWVFGRALEYGRRIGVLSGY
jgi:ABC-2 type transport system permease protein